MVFGVLIDGDGLIFRSKHRISPLHNIFLWIILMPIMYLLCPELTLVIVFALLHILMDMVDWGIYLFYPLSKRLIGPRVLARRSRLEFGVDSLASFIREYLSHRPLLVSEIILLLSAGAIYFVLGLA